MKKLSIEKALNKGWSAFEQRGWYLFGLSAAVVGLAMLAVGNATATALSYIIFGGYISLLLKHARNEKVVFDDLFTIDQRWIYFAFGGLIKGVIIALGLMLFIVPGVYLAVRWMFSDLYIIDQGMRPLEALKASSKLTEGYRWTLFWYALLMIVLTVVSLFFLLVGVFVAIAVLNLTTIFLFWRLQEITWQESQGQ